MKRLFLFIPVALVICLAGCKKDEGCAMNSTNIVGTYKLSGATYKASSTSPTINVFELWDACMRDNTITINGNGTYAATDAGVVCSTDDFGGTGIWTIENGKLYIDEEFTNVSAFSCSGMTFKIANTETEGDVMTMTFTKM